jgi:hypothetical protein
VDDVAPRHVEIHGDLEAWGRWSREKRARLECSSAERYYEARNGNVFTGPQYPEYVVPTTPGVPNPRNKEIDRAVIALPQLHLSGFRMHYWHKQIPEKTCRKLLIRPEHFSGFMTQGRDMVLNILRRQAQTA